MVLFILIYGFTKNTNIYDSFINGSKESFKMCIQIFPNLLAMILAMCLMRPISGSSTLAILNNIYSKYGPDSFYGRLASVIQGSTDTTFYVLTLYFGSIGIKKIRYSLIAGLFADLIGIIASIIIVNIMF